MPVNILHLHGSFDHGGKEARVIRLMQAFGDAARHTIVSADPDRMGARAAIPRGVRYEIAQDPPPLAGAASVARFEAIARYMRRFDLVLTYDWGAIDGVMARRAFAKGAPPLVHHEDGFTEDEASGLKAQRNIYRRIALPAASALVVPSEVLAWIAANRWKQPASRVRRIANGIATSLYEGRADPKAIPGLVRGPKEVVVGTVGGLTRVKDVPALVRAVGGLSGRIRMVVVGDGPERGAIEQQARAMGIGDKLVMPGFVDRPYRFLGSFDIFALSSLSEQQPTAVMEAMAAGLPIAAAPVGDVPRMVAAENAPFITEYPGEVRLRDALQPLVLDADLRRSVGAANRVKAVHDFDEAAMIAAYRALYEEVLGRPGALG
ncbi:glycosyltransferase involved in cell wall biosynthesis [Sphingomonas jinjuensis]|uniref:Glycosyltransferase involved in cell wall biosynthesis n=1 Tax=Sphingomonas jinjuensis TaxID=535907 RepID=A0A840FCQ0_9SPHN|nr:glycosyltransferase involved in cell wall biosynthesis [Sphingomonas jinjuensis]